MRVVVEITALEPWDEAALELNVADRISTYLAANPQHKHLAERMRDQLIAAYNMCGDLDRIALTVVA